MKRSAINHIVAEADEFIRRHGFVLSPFAVIADVNSIRIAPGRLPHCLHLQWLAT
ncbi:MAG: D-lyxose/D-mannose family sugar isomerase [Geminicoccaceae bacterium]